jgi:hypothetical protein
MRSRLPEIHIKFESLKEKKLNKTLSLCPVCQSNELEILHDFHDLPLTEFYVGDLPNELPSSFPQVLLGCANCTHIFLKNILDLSKIYDIGYQTNSSTASSSFALERFGKFIKENISENRYFNSAIDIGGNDASLFDRLELEGVDKFVIDPVLRSKNNRESTVNYITSFVESVDFENFSKSNRLFLCSHTLEHIKDPAIFFSNLQKQGADTDLFFFQFPSAEGLVKSQRWFQVHHQHIHYFTRRSFEFLLKINGFDLQNYQYDGSHYGAHQYFFTKASRETTTKNIEACLSFVEVKNSLESFLLTRDIFNNRLNPIAENLVGYGAGLMSALVYHHFPSLRSLMALVDDDVKKIGKKYIGTNHTIQSLSGLSNFDGIVVTGIVSESAYRKLIKNSFDICAQLEKVDGKYRDVFMPIQIA